jgi:hypothetical protein
MAVAALPAQPGSVIARCETIEARILRGPTSYIPE